MAVGPKVAAGVQALIIGAGRGARLSAASRGLPKPPVPILGVPIIDRTLSALREAGIDNVVVGVGYDAQRVHEHLLLARLDHPRTPPHP